MTVNTDEHIRLQGETIEHQKQRIPSEEVIKYENKIKEEKYFLSCIIYRGCTNHCWRLGIVCNGI